MRVMILCAVIVLAACDDDIAERNLFHACVKAAAPTSPEAINACRDAAWPNQRATQAAKQGSSDAN